MREDPLRRATEAAATSAHLRPLRRADDADVRWVFRATLAMGRTLPFEHTTILAYEELRLGWYLSAGRRAAVVARTTVGGPLDLLEHGHNAPLWAIDDPAGLRAGVARLAADPTLRVDMGASGRPGALRRTWAELGDELLGHYRSVLAPPATGDGQ